MKHDPELEHDVRATLHARAERINPPDRPFDPTWRPISGVDELALVRQRRRNPRVAVAVAAAALVVVASVAFLKAGDGGKARGTHVLNVPTTVVVNDPNLPVAPTWVPEGFRLSSVEQFGSGSVGPMFERPMNLPGRLIQTFQNIDDPEKLVVVQANRNPLSGSDPESPIEVRGAKAIEWGQPARLGDDSEDRVEITWNERGESVTATGTGVSTTGLVTFLDSLELRGDTPTRGFSPGRDGAWRVTSEEMAPKRVTSSPTLTLVYVATNRRDAGGNALQFRIDAWQQTGFSTQDNLLSDKPDGSGSRYDKRTRLGRFKTSDHRFADILSIGWTMSKVDMQRVAQSLSPVGASGIAALQAQAKAFLESEPVVATAVLDPSNLDMTVEVRGPERAPSLLCVKWQGRRECGRLRSGQATGAPLEANVTFEGLSIVVAAAPAVADSGRRLTIVDGSDRQALPHQYSAQVDGWGFVATGLPEDAESYVAIGVDGTETTGTRKTMSGVVSMPLAPLSGSEAGPAPSTTTGRED